MSLEAIETEFARQVRLIDGVRAVVEYEPERLPALPCVTMLFNFVQQDDRETGLSTDNICTWIVTLYIEVNDYRKAQTSMKELIQGILAVTRRDPTLGGLCDWTQIQDGGEPKFTEQPPTLSKSLRLLAFTSEL